MNIYIEYKKWLELFEAIITNNGYYEKIEEEYRNDRSVANKICKYYLDYVENASPYLFLECMENYMQEHNVDVDKALDHVGDFEY